MIAARLVGVVVRRRAVDARALVVGEPDPVQAGSFVPSTLSSTFLMSVPRRVRVLACSRRCARRSASRRRRSTTGRSACARCSGTCSVCDSVVAADCERGVEVAACSTAIRAGALPGAVVLAHLLPQVADARQIGGCRPTSPSAARPPGSRRTPSARRRRGSRSKRTTCAPGMCLIELSSTESDLRRACRRRRRPGRAAARRGRAASPGPGCCGRRCTCR